MKKLFLWTHPKCLPSRSSLAVMVTADSLEAALQLLEKYHPREWIHWIKYVDPHRVYEVPNAHDECYVFGNW